MFLVVLMSLYAFLGVYVGPCESLWVLLFVIMGAYRTVCVLKDSNVSLWILIAPDESFLVFMSPYRFLCVFRGIYGSLWFFVVLTGSYRSL